MAHQFHTQSIQTTSQIWVAWPSWVFPNVFTFHWNSVQNHYWIVYNRLFGTISIRPLRVYCNRWIDSHHSIFHSWCRRDNTNWIHDSFDISCHCYGSGCVWIRRLRFPNRNINYQLIDFFQINFDRFETNECRIERQKLENDQRYRAIPKRSFDAPWNGRVHGTHCKSYTRHVFYSNRVCILWRNDLALRHFGGNLPFFHRKRKRTAFKLFVKKFLDSLFTCYCPWHSNALSNFHCLSARPICGSIG